MPIGRSTATRQRGCVGGCATSTSSDIARAGAIHSRTCTGTSVSYVWPHAGAAFAAVFIIGFANPIVGVNASTSLQRLAVEVLHDVVLLHDEVEVVARDVDDLGLTLGLG